MAGRPGRSACELCQGRLERGRLGVYWMAARSPKWKSWIRGAGGSSSATLRRVVISEATLQSAGGRTRLLAQCVGRVVMKGLEPVALYQVLGMKEGQG